MKKYNKDIGNYGEFIAKDYLIRNNYRIICCNYRCPLGEVDIICSRDNIICFVEVKSRYFLKYGSPFDAVTSTKRKKIRNVCRWYIMKNKITDYYFRFDVISIIFTENDAYSINHIENAF